MYALPAPLFLFCTTIATAQTRRNGTDYAVFFVASKFDHGWAPLNYAPPKWIP